MAAANVLDIEVIHAEAASAVIKNYRIAPPATVADVLELAAATGDFGAIDLRTVAVGIFGQVVARSRLLEPGDRIELYGAPAVDPKEARRQRLKRTRPR